MSLRSGLIEDHVFKIRVIWRSCVEGQGCLDFIFLMSGLTVGHVFLSGLYGCPHTGGKDAGTGCAG